MLGAAAVGTVLCPIPRSAEAEPLIPAVQSGGRALTRWIELVNTHTS